MKTYLLFDLDGTLTDSQEGITNSVAYALRYYGIEEAPKELRKFIGPPLKESFMRFYDFSEERAEEAVWKYREYFEAGGMFENKVYEGIVQILKEQKESGKKLYIATSKPTVYTLQILKRFSLFSYFEDVQGSNLDGSRVKKEEVIRYVLEKNQIRDQSQAVMIGDREHDILGGRALGLDTIGVLYGFGEREELEKAKAGKIVSDVTELAEVLRKL